jgi:hypothetical protein
VVLGYVLSRLVFKLVFDISFDATPLPWFWQYIDPALLHTEPGSSLYYHHAQPPLFNAYLALALNIVSGDATLFFALTYLAGGLLLHVSIFALLARLGVRPWLAVAAALLFAISPASILYESWLFYTQPVAAVLAITAVSLHRLVRREGRLDDALLFCSLLAIAALTRSLFHLAWMLTCIGLVALALKPRGRRILLGAALPTLLVFSVYAKNWLEFGSFSTSTWMGMNLARLTTEPIPEQERRRLYQDGVISATSLVPPFARLTHYPGQPSADASLHPVLREPLKSTRAVNYNHIAYVGISRAYLDDALTLIMHEPSRYLATVAKAWLLFTMPPSEYWFLDDNREKIAGYDAVWNAVVYGVASAFTSEQVAYDRKDPAYLAHRFSIFWTLLALAALVNAIARGVAEATREGGDKARVVTLLFLASTWLYVALIGNAIEFRENNRFRFLVEPYLWVLVFFMIDCVIDRFSQADEERS